MSLMLTYSDADTSHQNSIALQCCFTALRQLRKVRRYVPESTFQLLVQVLVISRQDRGGAPIGAGGS